MKGGRYAEVMFGGEPLTESEMREGWHLCPEWGRLLIHPKHVEYAACTCEPFRRHKDMLVKKPLIRYIFHPHTKRYVGCLVALIHPLDHKIHIGWSQCRADERFMKKRGRNIATERALNGTNLEPCPYRFYNPDGSFEWRNTFKEELEKFRGCAAEYFTPRMADEGDGPRMVVILSLNSISGGEPGYRWGDSGKCYTKGG